MAHIEFSDEETQAIIDRVLDQVERSLTQRLESDLYRSVVRETSKRLIDKLASTLQEKAIEYYSKDKLDLLLDRVLQDKDYGSLQYALMDMARQAQGEVIDKLKGRIEASMRNWMKEGE